MLQGVEVKDDPLSRSVPDLALVFAFFCERLGQPFGRDSETRYLSNSGVHLIVDSVLLLGRSNP